MLSWACTSDKDSTDVNYDGVEFNINCAELESLFVTTPISASDDWSGYWECYQQENSCQGPSCSWDVSELNDYVLSESCSDAGSCEQPYQTRTFCGSGTNHGDLSQVAKQLS